jgi:acetyl esterase/lipase
MNVLPWVCLILSLLGLFLSSWTVIPAPTFSLLPLGVGAPEISPLLLLGNGVILSLAILQRQSWLSLGAIACSVLALILSSLPLLQLPRTVQHADQMMQSELGEQYLMQILPDRLETFRAQPFVFSDLFTGLSIAPIQPDRQFFLTSDGNRLPLDIYQPSTQSSFQRSSKPSSQISSQSSAQFLAQSSINQLHPAIVTIYGGAWQHGNPTQNETFHRYMAAQGYTVIAIDYRHAPQYRFPTQVQDVQAALAWIAQNASNLKIDPGQTALVGWSAGAHLALLAAYQSSPIAVQAVVSYYGPTNLTEGYANPPRPDPIHTRAVLETFLGGSPAEFPKRYEQASPIHHVKPGLPATLLIYGDRDHLVKSVFGRQLYDQLQQANNTAVWLPLPWAEHSFDAVFRGLGNQIALYYTERFLAWALR